jgi:hypothetical protein
LVGVADAILDDAVTDDRAVVAPEPQPTEAFSVEAEMEVEAAGQAEAPPTQLLDLELEPPLEDEEEILPFA